MNKVIQELTTVTAERKRLIGWLAQELMKEWGLTEKNWYFTWDNRKRSFGFCNWRQKSISLSLYLLPTINDEKAENTIRHEIAHALDAMERGKSDHSWRWKAWAVKVGAKPERCGHATEEDVKEAMPYKSKYRLECPNGHITPSHKAIKRSKSCGKCCPGYYNPEFKLEQILNHPNNIPQKFGGNASDPQ